jgi:hypothetical protein
MRWAVNGGERERVLSFDRLEVKEESNSTKAGFGFCHSGTMYLGTGVRIWRIPRRCSSSFCGENNFLLVKAHEYYKVGPRPFLSV